MTKTKAYLDTEKHEKEKQNILQYSNNFLFQI